MEHERRPTPSSRKAEAEPLEELTAREAANALGLKTSTVSGYIRSGRLPGRYEGAPTWRGWMTTRSAVDEYLKRKG